MFLPAASAQELSKQAKIERILDLTNSQATMDKMMDQVTAMVGSQMKSQMPGAGPEQVARLQEMQTKLMELVKSKMSWEKMRPLMVKVYEETYSEEEIDGMYVFFQSPAGRAYLSKMPELMQKTMTIMQPLLGDLMSEVQQLMKDSSEKE